MGKACRQEETDDQTHKNGQEDTQTIKAHNFRIGIAQQQIGNQRGNAGGEHHSIHQAAQFFPLDQGVQAYAQHGRNAVQGIDTPGAEAHSEDKGQGGHIVGLGLEHQQQRQTHQAHHCHIEERGRITAYPEIVGRDLAEAGQNLDPAGEHGAPVRHAESRHQEAQCEKAEEQLQKIGFREVSDLLHITPRIIVDKKGDPTPRIGSPRRSAFYLSYSTAVNRLHSVSRTRGL